MKILVLMSIVLLLSGCDTLGYYSQAVSGHFDVMSKRVPVAEVLASSEDAAFKKRLQLTQRARDFAVSDLALPDNDSYREYADLRREAVVWNVIAVPEFSLSPKRWCFPVAGCVVYKGFFDPDEAQALAEELSAQGLDTYVGQVSAYSTLGWFDDPLLNTMFKRGDISLAGLIFHELAHQQVYVAGESAFNESFATAVEQAGLRLWLQALNDANALARYEAYLLRAAQFRELLAKTRQQLAELYVLALEDAEKRERKRAIFADLRARYADLKITWQGYAGYDGWFAKPLNNARLALNATYHSEVPAFLQLLNDRCEGDFARFYQRVDDMTEAERNEPQRVTAC